MTIIDKIIRSMGLLAEELEFFNSLNSDEVEWLNSMGPIVKIVSSEHYFYPDGISVQHASSELILRFLHKKYNRFIRTNNNVLALGVACVIYRVKYYITHEYGQEQELIIEINRIADCLFHLCRYYDSLPLLRLLYNEHCLNKTCIRANELKHVHNFAMCLFALDKSLEALPLFELNAALHEELLDCDSVKYRKSFHRLADCLLNVGQANRAMVIYQELISRHSQNGNEYVSENMEFHEKMASCYENLGNNTTAIEIRQKVYEFNRDKLGEGHRDTISSLIYWAGSIKSSGDPQAALPLYERGLEQYKKIEGTEYFDEVSCLSNFADCLKSLGRDHEALKIFEEVYLKRVMKFGLDHAYSIVSLSNLGACYLLVGQTHKAISSLRKVVKQRLKILRQEHPKTLLAQSSLATSLVKSGTIDDCSEAIDIFKRILKISCRELGDEHPLTITIIREYAYCGEVIGSFQSALELNNMVWQRRRGILGETHPETLTSCRDLIRSYVMFKNVDYNARDNNTIQFDDRSILGYLYDLVRALCCTPQPGGRWMELLCNACDYLIFFSEYIDSEWSKYLLKLNAALLIVLDLQDPAQSQATRYFVTRFHNDFLEICIKNERLDLIPEIFASRQGRQLAALMSDELEVLCQSGSELARQYHEARIQLRKLALGLSIVESNYTLGMETNSPGTHNFTLAQDKLEIYRSKFGEFSDLQEKLRKQNECSLTYDSSELPGLSTIQNRIVGHQAVVLLFLHNYQETSQYYALLIHANSVKLYPLCTGDDFPVLPNYRQEKQISQFRLTLDEHGTCMDQTCSAQFDNDKLYRFMSRKFWEVLSPGLGGVSELSLVTHENMHLLPYEVASPDEIMLFTYPGLVYFMQGHCHTHCSPDKSSTLGIAFHPAYELTDPIPMVLAEADLLKISWPGRTALALNENNSLSETFDCLHLSGHGTHSANDPGRSYLYLGKSRALDFHAILRQDFWPPIVFLSSCLVGQVSEDPDGNPLGLMGALFMKGTSFVIASTQPVADYYMPIFTYLFYDSWVNEVQTPFEALALAKSRFINRNWSINMEKVFVDKYCSALFQEATYYLVNDMDAELAEMTWRTGFPEQYSHLSIEKKRFSKLKKAIQLESNCRELFVSMAEGFFQNIDQGNLEFVSTWIRGYGH